MKHIHTYESFTNEAYKDYTVIAANLVEIAAEYTDVDLTGEMNKAEKCNNPAKVAEFYEDLLEILTDEDIASKEVNKFQEQCLRFLKISGVPVR